MYFAATLPLIIISICRLSIICKIITIRWFSPLNHVDDDSDDDNAGGKARWVFSGRFSYHGYPPPNALQAHTRRVKELSNPAALRGIKRFYCWHLQDLSDILCLFVFSSLCELEWETWQGHACFSICSQLLSKPRLAKFFTVRDLILSKLLVRDILALLGNYKEIAAAYLKTCKL